MGAGEVYGLFDNKEKERMAARLKLEGPGGRWVGLDLAELEEGSDVFEEGAVGGGRVASGAENFEFEHLVAPLPLAAQVELRHDDSCCC